MGETTNRRDMRPNGEEELFQAAELERMGLLPAGGDRGAGELFVGDGVRAEGWYRAWTGGGLTVVTCDFTILVDTLFAIDARRYLTVRGQAPGAGGDAVVSGPMAIAYIETREGWVTAPVPAGSHFAYTEVEYFEGALRGAFTELGWTGPSRESRPFSPRCGTAWAGHPGFSLHSTRSPTSIPLCREPRLSTRGRRRFFSARLSEPSRRLFRRKATREPASLPPSNSRIGDGGKA